jgi:hypothetical protein
MTLTNTEIADLLSDYRRTRALMRELKGEMLRVAVEQLGMDQTEAREHQIDDFLDGYLVGQGVQQNWRKIGKAA